MIALCARLSQCSVADPVRGRGAMAPRWRPFIYLFRQYINIITAAGMMMLVS